MCGRHDTSVITVSARIKLISSEAILVINQKRGQCSEMPYKFSPLVRKYAVLTFTINTTYTDLGAINEAIVAVMHRY